MANKKPHEIPEPETLLKHQRKEGANFYSEDGRVEPVEELANENIVSLEGDQIGEYKMTDDNKFGQGPRELEYEGTDLLTTPEQRIPGFVSSNALADQECMPSPDEEEDLRAKYGLSETLKVVVLDDDEDVRSMVREAFEEDPKYQVITIETARAYSAAPTGSGTIHVLDLDLRMEGYNAGDGPSSGYKALEAIAQRGTFPRAVLLHSSFGKDVIATSGQILQNFDLIRLQETPFYIVQKADDSEEIGEHLYDVISQIVNGSFEEQPYNKKSINAYITSKDVKVTEIE